MAETNSKPHVPPAPSAEPPHIHGPEGNCNMLCVEEAENAKRRADPAPVPSGKPPYVDIVFDGPPSHVAGRFVEAESPAGVGVRIGEWIDRGDGYWALRIPLGRAPVADAAKEKER